MALSSDSSLSAVPPNCVEDQKNQEPSLVNESSKNKLASSNGSNPAPEALEFISLISGTDGNSSADVHRDPSTSLGEMGKPSENPIFTHDTSKGVDTGSAHSLSSAIVLSSSESDEVGSCGAGKTQVSSITCTLTTAHHESIVSVMANSIPAIKASGENLDTNKQMPEATLKCTRSTDEHPSERKTSFENISIGTLSSSSWSSSADTNADCETGSCQGTEVKCRLCGKIVPKSNKIDQVSCSRNGEGPGRSSIFCDGALRKSQANPKGNSTKSVDSDGTKSTIPKKKIVPSSYSTLLSSCGRSTQPKGNRRSSIDVIYARDSSEPKIDKINAKRRLSRQTDISSLELMTLTEGNEKDESIEKSKVKHQKQTASDTKEGNIFSPLPELRLKEGSSLDNFPRVPFNSFETASSLEIEEKLLSNLALNYSLGRGCKSGSDSFVKEKHDLHQQDDDIEDPEEEEGQEEEEEDNDEVEVDEAGAVEDEKGTAKLGNTGENNAKYTDTRDPVDEYPTGSTTFAKISYQTKKKKKPPCKKRKGSHAALSFDWTSEALIIVALFVYLACKTLRFLEIFSPSRQRRNKK